MNSGRRRREEKEAAGRVLPLGVLYAQFIDVYGSREFHDPRRWPTRDGVIPFLLFYRMVGAMANVRAAHQLVVYYAALLAGAQVTGGEEGHSQRDDAVRSLVETAYPSVPAKGAP